MRDVCKDKRLDPQVLGWWKESEASLGPRELEAELWQLREGAAPRHEDGRGARRESPPCRREAVEDSWPLASVLHLPAAPRAAEERLPVAAGDL